MGNVKDFGMDIKELWGEFSRFIEWNQRPYEGNFKDYGMEKKDLLGKFKHYWVGFKGIDKVNSAYHILIHGTL